MARAPAFSQQKQTFEQEARLLLLLTAAFLAAAKVVSAKSITEVESALKRVDLAAVEVQKSSVTDRSTSWTHHERLPGAIDRPR